MFLTVTPNICIERTLLIENCAVGNVHRIPPEKLWVTAGGKGINAARVAGKLGARVCATGWVGNNQRQWFEAQLQKDGIAHDLVGVDADTRTCINILDGEGLKTEFVEAGTPLSIDDGTRMLSKFEALLPAAKLAAVCGSYPPAASGDDVFDNHLALLLRLSQRHKVRVIIDGKGRSFAIALRSGTPPWCIKPNIDEAAQFLGRPIRGENSELRAVRDLLHLGIEVVLLSCGERGAYLGTQRGTYLLQGPAIDEISPVGSGDSMVGAFAARYLECGDVLDAARWGVAAGAANAAQIRAANVSRKDVEELLPYVKWSLRL